MEELRMKALLESNNQWEFAFRDVGKLVNQDDEEAECLAETNKITTTAQEQYSEVPAATEYSTEDEKEDDLLQVLKTLKRKKSLIQKPR